VYIDGTTGSLAVNGQGGNDSVTVGGAGRTTQAVAGPVNVTNPTGVTILVVDDSNDTFGRTVTLVPGSVSGLSPTPVTWTPDTSSSEPGGVGRLILDGGSGNNIFSILNTDAFYQYTAIAPGTGTSANAVNV